MEIILPKNNDSSNKEVLNIESNSLVIIGANGSGKSKLGAWIEKEQYLKVHRIGAQRALSFGDYIQQRSYEQATNLLITGVEQPTRDHNHRWGNWDGEQYGYTTSLLNDFDFALSALLALKYSEQESFVMDCKSRDKEKKLHSPVPEMVDDKLVRIWKSVFPHREVKIHDGKIIAIGIKNGARKEYKGKGMSDGERVALYLIAQSLCIPNNKIIIIDEPEIHLHRSILNNLWNEIEKERVDCTFIYITHDTQFASSRNKAKKLWVKSFDGDNWEFDFINSENIPEQLLLDILGNRKPVIFVEGENESNDTKLYSELYKNYYIIPTGSCSSVIAYTKAMRKNSYLHHLNCYGIIDKDFRTEYEINKLEVDGIFTLNVAEVENLFIVEELLEIINIIQKFQDNDRINKFKNYVIDERYSNQIQQQICESVVSEVKYKLTVASVSNKNEVEAKSTIKAVFDNLDYNSIKVEHESRYLKALNDRNYSKVLELFNSKSLVKFVGNYFGLENREYIDFVFRHLNSDNRTQIVNALTKYLPLKIEMK